MTQIIIKGQIETALEALWPKFFAHENDGYTPKDNVPYAELTYDIKTTNPTVGGKLIHEDGWVNVLLKYPADKGAGAANERAQAIKDAFGAPLSFVTNNVTTVIYRTPEELTGYVDGGRWAKLVRIYFFANYFKGD